MTQKEHVYAIQNLLNRGQVSDDKDFSNRFIAHMLKLNRAILLKRKMDKYMDVDPLNKQRVCMPLIESQYVECPNCDLPNLSCVFYKSIAKLPQALVSKQGASYTIRLLDGTILNPISVMNNRYGKYFPGAFSSKGWFIADQYLYVAWPNDKDHLPLEHVVPEFIAEDPEEMEGYSVCTSTSSVEPCVDSDPVRFPIDSDLIHPLYKMTLEMLGVSYSLPEDDLNNAVSADGNKSNE